MVEPGGAEAVAQVALEIPPEWLPGGVTPKQVNHGLRPLLERPVEHVLDTHDRPRDRAALERALS